MKKTWARKGSRPVRLVTGSKKKTCVYGVLSEDGQQLFRHYPKCNTEHFLTYMTHLIRKFKKLILFVDKAPWHTSKKTTAFFKEHANRLTIHWFPAGFPESNPVEECWHQGKYDDNLGATFHATYEEFIHAVTTYYRTKRFNLDLLRYLCR